MSGQIHGMIRREEAWRMWRPYGERVDLDGTVEPDTLTNEDALWILLGADEETHSQAYGCWYDPEDDRPWYMGITDVDLRSEPELVELLLASQHKQQRRAERIRMKAIADGPEFIRRLGRGALALHREKFLTSPQLNTIESWMTAPDGQPYIQYAPMTQLEYARLALKYDGEPPTVGGADCTDFSLGVIRSVIGSTPQSKFRMRHNKVHESVHANFSGIETFDITRDDGSRRPEATIVGVFASEPTTEIWAGDDYSTCTDVELNEGWTDFIARQLMRVEPKLGQIRHSSSGYSDWANVIGELLTKAPRVYEALTDAVLTEADPLEPEHKRQKISEMHAYADRLLGEKSSLDHLFRATGKSILDLYSKRAKKEKLENQVQALL